MTHEITLQNLGAAVLDLGALLESLQRFHEEQDDEPAAGLFLAMRQMLGAFAAERARSTEGSAWRRLAAEN